MRALVVGNRPLDSKVIELSKNSLVIAADAGADRLLKYNITPDVIIGDLDSVSDKTITRLEEWTISNKNVQKTDLEKAVDHAFEKRAEEVIAVSYTHLRAHET